MKTATINTRIDPVTKKSAEAVFAKLGLSTSDAINLFFHHVSAYQGIPFELRVPNAETRKAMRQAVSGKSMEKLKSIEDLWNH